MLGGGGMRCVCVCVCVDVLLLLTVYVSGCVVLLPSIALQHVLAPYPSSTAIGLPSSD